MSNKDSMYLTPESGEVKGNNPYQLNRMRIDPSFKATNYDLSKIVGYGATGEVIYAGQKMLSEQAQSGECALTEHKRPAAGSLAAANQVSPLANYDTESECFSASGKRSRKNKKKKSTLRALEMALETRASDKPDWVSEFVKQSSVASSNLTQLTEDSYRKIMNQPRQTRY
jgi:hypothetical protein